MSGESESREKGEEQQPQEPDISAAIAALNKKIDGLKAQQEPAEPEEPPKPVEPKETPKPPRPPERDKQTAKEYLEMLAQFGTEQAQKAYAYELGHNLGVDPNELLDANYSRPEDMLAAAQRMAAEKASRERIEALEQKLQALEESRAQPPVEGEGEEPSPASVDTGGPTSTKSDLERELEDRYSRAKAHGRTVEGRYKLLEAIYRDPSKVIISKREHVA